MLAEAEVSQKIRRLGVAQRCELARHTKAVTHWSCFTCRGAVALNCPIRPESGAPMIQNRSQSLQCTAMQESSTGQPWWEPHWKSSVSWFATWWRVFRRWQRLLVSDWVREAVQCGPSWQYCNWEWNTACQQCFKTAGDNGHSGLRHLNPGGRGAGATPVKWEGNQKTGSEGR